MQKLEPGDTINCMIKSSLIVSPYHSYDEIKDFVIVAKDNCGYYLYVPHYYNIKNSIIVDSRLVKNLGINKKYLDENIVYIDASLISSIDKSHDGLACKICKNFATFASSNQEDGTFICFSCRQNPHS